MLTRPLGNTGLTISALAFGCGNVGGLFTTEASTDAQMEALERAWNVGVLGEGQIDSPRKAVQAAIASEWREQRRGGMPTFKVGDRVRIPASQPVPLKGAIGIVREVRLGTGYGGKSPSAGGRLDQYSTPHEYVVDFGSPHGLLPVVEELLESAS
ncbi:MAG: hypothetical protein O3B84_03535 [Chloroflexi bacterium]|nr:hypothetical protein [Chloroflexota bacterium]